MDKRLKLCNLSQFAESFRPFVYPLTSQNPWFMSLEITMNNAIILFYALQSNNVLNARLLNGYPSLVALLL